MQMRGLSLDQAPPMTVVAGFFGAAPLFVMLAGGLVALHPTTVFVSPWLPETLALTHLGTLGFLGMIMLGALYQMLPVVGGAAVPFVRLAHLVNLSLALAVVAFFAGQFAWGGLIAAVALVLFLLPVGWALVTTETRTDTVWGMRLAVLSLLSLGVFGWLMSRGFGETAFGATRYLDDRASYMAVHLTLGLVCWVGGLISAVSWQVVPMFYLAAEVPALVRRTTLVFIGAATLSLPCLPLLSLLDPPASFGVAAAAVALPAALAVWVLHPLSIFAALKQRRRKRRDETLAFWRTGLALGPVTLVLGCSALFSDDARFGLAFGWVAIWGWAGNVMHGTIHRIVPFLVWFHQLSALVGFADVPSAKQLLPGSRTTRGYWLHQTTLVCGVISIVSGWGTATLVTGAALCLTAVSLLDAFVRAALMGRRHRAQGERARDAALDL